MIESQRVKFEDARRPGEPAHPPEPIPIAFVVTDLDAGGAERMLVQLVTRLDRQDWAPVVYCLSPGGALVEPLTAAGIDVKTYGARGLRHLPGTLRRLRRDLRRQAPRLLQSMLFHANIVGRLAGRSAGVPVIVSGIRVAERRRRGYLLLDRWTAGMVQRHVCVSRGVAEHSAVAGGLCRESLVVIPNGVAARRFAEAEPVDLAEFGIPPGSQTLISVGRLDVQKGLTVLIDAVATLAVEFPLLHVLLVGEGPQREELAARVDSCGLSDRVHFCGWRPDVERLLKSADLLALPSLWEGMPNALMEAMASGLPVISSRIEGTDELIEEGVNGLLVTPGSVGELAGSIRRVLEDTELRERLGREAQETVSKSFTWESVVSSYVELYRKLLSESAAGRTD